MLAQHFFLIISIWVGLSLIPIFTGAYFSLQMQNHRVPQERPMWDMRAPFLAYDPANFTEIGQAYRRKAFGAQLTLGGWLLISMIIAHYL